MSYYSRYHGGSSSGLRPSSSPRQSQSYNPAVPYKHQMTPGRAPAPSVPLDKSRPYSVQMGRRPGR